MVHEGPSHESLQYWWTDWHLNNSKMVTLVTTRCSSSSYLSWVELQNGCLSLSHASTSTISGSNCDNEIGTINQAKLKENSRVNGCPCGDTNIQLIQGSDSSHLQGISIGLDTFLKGSKEQKGKLQNQQPELYKRFQRVWDVHNRHYGYVVVPVFSQVLLWEGLPTSCVPITPLRWYPDWTTVHYLPFLFPDPQRPWGGMCETCKDFCCGHYISKLVDITNPQEVKTIMPPWFWEWSSQNKLPLALHHALI